MVLQMGLPGSGCISLCILGRKYIFPAFGESTNNRSARLSSITLLIAAFPTGLSYVTYKFFCAAIG